MKAVYLNNSKYSLYLNVIFFIIAPLNIIETPDDYTRLIDRFKLSGMEIKQIKKLDESERIEQTNNGCLNDIISVGQVIDSNAVMASNYRETEYMQSKYC